MGAMEERYLSSNKPRPAEARNIPNLAVNMVDIQNQYQTQFKTFTQKGQPTTYTAKALDYYSDEVANMVLPEGYQPVEQGVQINRWTPAKGYYNPGAGQG